MKEKVLLFLCIVSPLFFSCNKSENSHIEEKNFELVDSIAVVYYTLFSEGRFSEYINAMLSCDNTTPKYKQSIEKMLKQHRVQIEKDKKGIGHITALRKELYNDDKFVMVYLSISYGDNTNEEIIFPLVFDGKKWRIQ